MEDEGWRFVAFLRLVPLVPFNLTNYALGLTRIRFLPYVLTSLVCMAPGAIAYTWLGHAGREAMAGDASAIRYGLLALGLLAVIAFLPRLIARWRGRRPAWTEPDELRRRMAAGDGITVVDVRGRDEFDGPLGHIPAALNVPLPEIEGRLDELCPRNEGGTVIVCRTDKRSAAAQASLRSAGFNGVSVLRGGMERWTALGFEAVRGDRNADPESLAR